MSSDGATRFPPQLSFLEPAAQALVEATAKRPFLSDLGPVEGRRALDTL